MRSYVVTIGLLLLVHCAVGNGSSSTTDSPTSESGEVVLRHRVIAEGNGGPGALQSGRRSPWVEVVLDQEKLAELWRAYVSDDPAPVTDFSDSTVILLLTGPRPTGGYSIELIGLEIEDRVLRVRADLHEPAAGSIVTQAFTAPHVAIHVESRDFDRVEWINHDRILWTEILAQP